MMETEIKFLSKEQISIEEIRSIVLEICAENNWSKEIQHSPRFDNYKNGSYEFSIFINNELALVAQILCESYREFWSLSSTDYYPKSHLGNNCYYILKYLYLGGDGYDVTFLLDFAIAFANKESNVIVETMERNDKTCFEEYHLSDLLQIKSSNLHNNWKAIKSL